MADQIIELTESLQWGTGVAKLYEEFVQAITDGELPGITVEDLRKIEKELGIQ